MDQKPDDDVVLGPGDALVIADLQNDFLPGGALGVLGGDEVVPVVNEYLRRFRRQGLPVYVTRDWHPAGHCSFRSEGGPWPTHCIAGTPGAAFAPDLIAAGRDDGDLQGDRCGARGVLRLCRHRSA